jgi:virginiamycin B lyase
MGTCHVGRTRAAVDAIVCATPFTAVILDAGPASAAVTVVRHTLPVADQSVEPNGIAQGSDGNIWFTYSFRQDVARITPAGVVTDFPIPTFNSDSGPMAAGSDGALWWTEYQANKIARVSTAGVVTEYSLPSGGNPQFITAGPDNALWFSEAAARRIGRIDTSGTITEFAIPGPNRGAEGIASGSDGAIWFADPLNARVGRITTTGTVRYVNIPPRGGVAVPGQMAAGPDGNLWVTDDRSMIDRVTPAGVVTEFPDSAAFGASITAGPDGALWLGTGSNTIQRVTTAGVITNEATLTGEAGQLTTGPGGSLWWTILNIGEVDSTQLGTQGFRIAGVDGNAYSFGADPSLGSLVSLGIHPAAPVVGLASTSAGYRMAGTDGAVYVFGTASYLGSLPGLGIVPARPVVGISSPPSGTGYRLAGADGGVFWFGAPFLGSLPGLHVVPNQPIVGVATTPSGLGYWLVGADGGVYAFGDAAFLGSLPGLRQGAQPRSGHRADPGRRGLLARHVERRRTRLRRCLRVRQGDPDRSGERHLRLTGGPFLLSCAWGLPESSTPTPTLRPGASAPAATGPRDRPRWGRGPRPGPRTTILRRSPLRAGPAPSRRSR